MSLANHNDQTSQGNIDGDDAIVFSISRIKLEIAYKRYLPPLKPTLESLFNGSARITHIVLAF